MDIKTETVAVVAVSVQQGVLHVELEGTLTHLQIVELEVSDVAVKAWMAYYGYCVT